MRKSKNLQKKLSLSKTTITKLIDPHKIWGGTGNNDPGDGTDNPNKQNDDEKEKCIADSAIIIKE